MARFTEDQLQAARLALPGLCDMIHAAYWLRNSARGSAETYANFADDELQKLALALGYRLVPVEVR